MMEFDRYDPVDLRELYEAEQEARREGRQDAADALERRRMDVATCEDGSDARYVCTDCGGNEIAERELDRHKSVGRHALVCLECEEIVGVKLDKVGAGCSVAGVREIEVAR